MPVYRITFGFAGANTGWTETHSMQHDSTIPGNLLPLLKPIQQARVLMLGWPFVCNGVRISTYSDGGSPPRRLPRSVYLDKTVYSNQDGGPLSSPAEPAVVALQAQGFAGATAPVAYQGNQNWTYLGAPCDDCVTQAGVVLPAKLGLAAAFNQWKAAMIAANMGWLAVTKMGNKLPLSTFTNLGSGQVEYVTTGADATILTAGSTYNIRVSGVNKGRSPLNGAQVATMQPLNTWTTSEQIAFALNQVGGGLQPYSRVLTHVPYFNLVLALQTIEHERGKPFLSRRGRRPNRVRA